VLDLQARSWADYGPKVGAWRLLDVLQRLDVRSVFYVSGILAERYGDLMKAIVQGGHAVAAHGWGQDIIPSYQTAEEEARDLERCVKAIGGATGQRPMGWLSPRVTPSTRTSALLAKCGFDWHADFFDSDLPYRHQTPDGEITAVPFTMEVNDMPLYVRYGAEPEAFTRILERIVGNWPRLGRPAGLPRHHRPRPRLRPAVRRHRVHELPGGGPALRGMGLAHRSSDLGGASARRARIDPNDISWEDRPNAHPTSYLWQAGGGRRAGLAAPAIAQNKPLTIGFSMNLTGRWRPTARRRCWRRRSGKPTSTPRAACSAGR
jgi:hypothetical protein